MINQNSVVPLKLVALAPNSWDGQWVNRQQLLSRLGRRFRILYSTGGWFSWDRHSSEWRQAPFRGSIQHTDNVGVDHSPRYLLRMPRLPLVDSLVLQLQARRWRRLVGNDGALVAYLFHPCFYPYLQALRPDFVVYHAYDLFDHTPGWNAQLEDYERRLLAEADLTIASSGAMAEGLQEKGCRPVRVLPNGADVTAFFRAQTEPEPTDLAKIPHPRLGYIGSLHPHVDYGLVAALAQRRFDWHFVFVGGKVSHPDVRAKSELNACHTLPNVHFLGFKEHYRVPAYVVNMDVNLLCYSLSDNYWIKAGYPLKLHEYLAAGRSVVSADLASVRPFATVVRIASGVEDWYQAICEAIEGGVGDPEQRRSVANQNSWEARVQVLENWLLDLVGTNQSKRS